VRAIVFLLFVILVFFILRFTINRIIAIREQNRLKEAKKTEQASSKDNPQAMVRCAECGIHLPQSEAYYDGKDTFCSEGHMQSFHNKANDSKNKSAQGDFQVDREKQETGDSDD